MKKYLPILSDMDGVISPSRKLWVETEFSAASPFPKSGPYCVHEERRYLSVFKEMSDHDSWIISRIRDQLVFISGDDRVNKAWADRQSIPFIDTSKVKHSDKWEHLCEYWKENRKEEDPETPERSYYYIGDSMPDLVCILNAKFAFIPADASNALKSAIVKRGQGYFRYVHYGQRIKGDRSTIFMLESKGGEGCLDETVCALNEAGLIKGNIDV